jgi:hypothetical protein
MRLHYGIHVELEEAANELLRKEVADLPRSQKMDLLTPWKERDRLSREVYNSEGIPDGSLRRGMFHRAWNPQHTHLNSRDATGYQLKLDTVTAYVSEQGYQDRAGEVEISLIRPMSECRILRWGNQMRLQCVPCIRYLPRGTSDRTKCKRCRTTYIRQEVAA